MTEEAINNEQITTENVPEQKVPLSRLQKETAKLREAESKLKALEEAKLKETENYKALYEKTVSEKAELQKKVFDTIKNSIAVEYGLPPQLRSRLAGETEEELRSDAEFLASLIKKDVAPDKKEAPKIDAGIKSVKTDKPVSAMSPEEYQANRIALLEQLKSSFSTK